MSVETYIPGIEKIVHTARVDFLRRGAADTVYMVQYDSVIPVIGVELYSRGAVYTLPSDALLEVKVRWGKKDSNIFVYKTLLGCNAARNIVYLEVDAEMTDKDGFFNIVIEMSFGGNSKAGTSPIIIVIEPNPIQEA